MESKQEIIKQAYGEHWELIKNHIDENGWVDTQTFSFARKGIEFDFYKKRTKSYLGYYNRPKSLEGIEDNNGWIKLNGLPNEITNRCSMWIMTKNGIEYLKENEFLPIGYATHYKPIEKPKPPIY